MIMAVRKADTGPLLQMMEMRAVAGGSPQLMAFNMRRTALGW